MNIQQLKTTLESKLGETFSESQVITYFNECLQEDLAGVLRLETVAELPITAEVTLPLNLMKLVYVEANGAELDELALNDYDSDGYKVFANVLKPQNVEGTLKLYYHRYPAEVTSITNTPDIPTQFKHALYYYALARYQQDDEELQWEQDYEKLYQKIKAQIDEYTRQKQGSGVHRRVRVVY